MLLAFYNVNRMLHACHVIYFGKRARCHFKCHLLLFMRIHFFCNLQYQGVLFLISPSPQLVRIFLINKVTCYANKCFLICLIPSYLYRLFYSLKRVICYIMYTIIYFASLILIKIRPWLSTLIRMCHICLHLFQNF